MPLLERVAEAVHSLFAQDDTAFGKPYPREKKWNPLLGQGHTAVRCDRIDKASRWQCVLLLGHGGPHVTIGAVVLRRNELERWLEEPDEAGLVTWVDPLTLGEQVASERARVEAKTAKGCGSKHKAMDGKQLACEREEHGEDVEHAAEHPVYGLTGWAGPQA